MPANNYNCVTKALQRPFFRNCLLTSNLRFCIMKSRLNHKARDQAGKEEEEMDRQYKAGQEVELTTQAEYREGYGTVTSYYDDAVGLACEGFQTVILTAEEAETLNAGGWFTR